MLQKNTIDFGKSLALVLISLTVSAGASQAGSPREQVIRIVTQIQRADYEGDRAALKRLYADLTPFIENKDLASRVRYWRGFALWRRAINGFNDHAAPAELQEDLKLAAEEFAETARRDPTFADARIGSLSCLGFLMFSIHQQDPTSPQIQELIAQARQLRNDAEAIDPDNPRLWWVLGPMLWNIPPEHGGGQGKAIAGYEKALETNRKRSSPGDPLQPSWGEPELLMSLAWSNLNRTTPDLDTAEHQAEAALKRVPYWHYVRDILLPQIREARRNQKAQLPL